MRRQPDLAGARSGNKDAEAEDDIEVDFEDAQDAFDTPVIVPGAGRERPRDGLRHRPAAGHRLQDRFRAPHTSTRPAALPGGMSVSRRCLRR